jgi:sn-glycerol 3-phosphate transport system substrate-binding protein
VRSTALRLAGVGAVIAAMAIVPVGAAGAGGGQVCPVHALDKAKKPVEITFWHSHARSNEEVLESLVDQFEGANPDIDVKLVNQTTYPDTLDKYRAGLSTGDLPDVVQMEETVVQSLVDSKSTVPIGACAKADKYPLDDFLPRAIEYFTLDGQLQAMPWTISNPILYYDMALFRKAGLDPEKPPATLDEVREYSQKIVDSGAAPHGIALPARDYLNEFFYAKAGQEYVNHGNGRKSRATKALLDNKTGRAVWTWWKDMEDSGLLLNTGTNRESIDHLLAMGNGDAAMTIEASGGLGPVFDVLSTGQYDHVEPGVGPMPSLKPGGGVPVGDGALWMAKASSPEKKAAAWKLVKFFSEPAQQAAFAIGSKGGYIPIRRSALDDPALQALWAENPALRVPYDQLESGPTNAATVGSVIGDYQGVRDAVAEGLTRMFAEGVSPKQALAGAQKQADAAIQAYNDRLGV